MIFFFWSVLKTPAESNLINKVKYFFFCVQNPNSFIEKPKKKPTQNSSVFCGTYLAHTSLAIFCYASLRETCNITNWNQKLLYTRIYVRTIRIFFYRTLSSSDISSVLTIFFSIDKCQRSIIFSIEFEKYVWFVPMEMEKKIMTKCGTSSHVLVFYLLSFNIAGQYVILFH